MMDYTAITKFFQHFRLVPVNDATLLREVYRMRYEVYCQEMGFEQPELFPEGLEHDSYDRRSRHCLLLHRASSTYAGCVRLILHDKESPNALFPFEKYCGDSLRRDVLDPAALPAGSFGEISRLTVRAAYRRRRGDESPEGLPSAPAAGLRDERRGSIPIALGLYLAGAALGLMEGLAGVFVMMEPRLARHLSVCDIRFTPVGNVVEYHGRPRGAFHISRDDLLAQLSPPLRYLLDRILADLNAPAEEPRPEPRIQTG
jgi:N-acyl amino acid synthase of PEP-CTERM/exosortase system